MGTCPLLRPSLGRAQIAPAHRSAILVRDALVDGRISDPPFNPPSDPEVIRKKAKLPGMLAQFSDAAALVVALEECAASGACRRPQTLGCRLSRPAITVQPPWLPHLLNLPRPGELSGGNAATAMNHLKRLQPRAANDSLTERFEALFAIFASQASADPLI